MNTPEDNIWANLLAQSAPTFAGETTPPFGLATRILASLREERRQEADWMRIGRRAIFASVATVVIMAVVTFVRVKNDDVDAPVKSLALVANLQVS